ncbi:hypothetical protein U0070_001315 [Myodes glareolus]|uniref:Uncharacterized protein n=1 Tax=Myodes glareolus TaxID=447135 RepID=A0AAW0HZD7_MYOGA
MKNSERLSFEFRSPTSHSHHHPLRDEKTEETRLTQMRKWSKVANPLPGCCVVTLGNDAISGTVLVSAVGRASIQQQLYPDVGGESDAQVSEGISVSLKMGLIWQLGFCSLEQTVLEPGNNLNAPRLKNGRCAAEALGPPAPALQALAFALKKKTLAVTLQCEATSRASTCEWPVAYGLDTPQPKEPQDIKVRMQKSSFASHV